ncbi:hypothetical protein CHUAL_007139 [Chamberlinius hualienensis]
MFDVDRNQSDIGLHKSLVPADSSDLKRKERSIMSMGDVLPPRRQAVMDRLRRRIERYRLHHLSSCLPRYNSNLNGILQQQQQDTIILRQRFLEAKAKKSGKKSEPKSKAGLGGDSSSAGGGGAGGATGTGSTSASNSGAGGGGNGCGAGGTATANSNTTVSGPQPKYKRTEKDTSSSPLSGCSRSASGQSNGGEGNVSGQQIQTNVKVTTVASNNIKTSNSPAPSTGNSVVNGGGASVTSSTTTTTTVIEPSEHGGDVSARNVSKVGGVVAGGPDKSLDENRDTKGSFHLPEFKPEPTGSELNLDACGVEINDETFEALMNDFSSDDMDQMNLEDIVDPFRLDHSHLSSLGDHKMNIDNDNGNLGQLPPYPVVSQSGLQLQFPGSSPTSDSLTMNLLSNMANTSVRPPSYTGQSSLGLNFLGKESSPAAQTLKQMAEQHQQQRQQQQLNSIGLNTSSPFSSDFNQYGGPGSGTSIEFLSSSGGNPNCFMQKNGAGSLFPFDSNSMTSPSGNKGSDGLFRSNQRFHLPTHLQDATKNPLNQQRTTDSKNICSGNGVTGGGPSANMMAGHCSPDVSSGAGPTGSQLSFVGTKPLSHFGDSNQPNNNGSNNGTRQYMRNSGGPTQQQRSQVSVGGASSPSNTVPSNLRQQRHHYMGMTNTQNGHHLQVSQGQHVNVSQDQQSTTMFSYGQAPPQVTPSAPGDHFQLSLNQSQEVTFNAAGANSIQNADRMVSINQTAVVQMNSGGPSLNMMNHHSQLLRPPTMHSQSDQAQQQQQLMQMQLDKRKLNQQQVRNNHAGLTQFGVRPPPPDYGSQMNLMSSGQQQQSMMAGVMTSQSGQMLMNNNSIRGGNGVQPRLPSAMNVGNGGQMPLMNGRNVQQMNLGSMGLNTGGVPVNSNRTNLGMPGRMASFIGDDPRPPNVDIGPDGLNIALRGNVGGVGQDWRQRMTVNQHPGVKYQGTNVGQMSGVNTRFAGQLMPDQRGLQQNNVDNMQMITMQQQHLNMLNRMGSGVNNGPSHSGHHHHQMQHQQMSIIQQQQQQQQQQGNSSSQQSVNAHLMSHISSSVVSSTGTTNFLPSDTASGVFNDFFESGGFGANDLLNSFDLDIQNGNSGDNLL